MSHGGWTLTLVILITKAINKPFLPARLHGLSALCAYVYLNIITTLMGQILLLSPFHR